MSDPKDPKSPKWTKDDYDRQTAQKSGQQRNGNVDLRCFDEGVILTMGGEIFNQNYYLDVDGVAPAPGLPGVPITFGNPEDIFEKFKVPAIVIRRDDIFPAMNRWHPGAMKYRVPAAGAIPIIAKGFGGIKTGYSAYEEQAQAMPFDIFYTISIIGRHRGGLDGRAPELLGHSNRILSHLMTRFTPYGSLMVFDKDNNFRTYEAFMEGSGMVDSTSEVSHRVAGFALNLRVEGELDHDDPRVSQSVTQVNTTFGPVLPLRSKFKALGATIGKVSTEEQVRYGVFVTPMVSLDYLGVPDQGSITETRYGPLIPAQAPGKPIISGVAPMAFARFSDVVAGAQGPISVDAGVATSSTTKLSITVRIDKPVLSGTLTARVATQNGVVGSVALTSATHAGAYSSTVNAPAAVTMGDLIVLEILTDAGYTHTGGGVAAVKVAAQLT